jgi:dihydrofolate reductase
VVNGSLTAFVKKLKRRVGKDIYLGGGGELARSFLEEDLVDEMFIGLGPVLLGDGIPAARLQTDRVQVLREWIGGAALRTDTD